ncbi:hypothetical protein F4805DRAFT_421321 [Annulohypoxylon moriforme]|nr:hypothetical protein F4805DRAFT_421321 [Annulohypoxylon moriforme]
MPRRRNRSTVAAPKHWNDVLGICISRIKLITLLVMINSRPPFQYSDAAGLRANFSHHNRQWYISWPLDKPVLVRVFPHDSHKQENGVYPPTFKVHVNSRVEISPWDSQVVRL